MTWFSCVVCIILMLQQRATSFPTVGDKNPELQMPGSSAPEVNCPPGSEGRILANGQQTCSTGDILTPPLVANRAAHYDSRRWPKDATGVAKVYYSMETYEGNAELVEGYIADMSNKLTCIDLVDITTVQPRPSHFIDVIYDSGCYSYVGNIDYYKSPQPLSIGNGCEFRGVVEHEFMHALGIYHEQSRPDRDDYVTIKFENIEEGREGNFALNSHSRTFDQPYEIGSVMHYGGYDFSKNDEPTIIDKSTNMAVVAQRVAMTEQDIKDIHLYYECNIAPEECTSENTYCDSYCEEEYTAGKCKKESFVFKCQKKCDQCVIACRDIKTNCVDDETKCAKASYRAVCAKTCGGGTCDDHCVCPCGKSMEGSVASSPGRIAGGNDAAEGKWAFIILLTHTLNADFRCAGTLITNQWIVTAAHCVSGESKGRLRVRAGEYDTTVAESYTQDERISKIVIHPLYDGLTFDNDIALLRLKNPVIFGDYVQPACLPEQDDAVPNLVELAGWGDLVLNGAAPDILNEVTLDASTTCQPHIDAGDTITSNMFCAGDNADGSCQGDGGGPLAVVDGESNTLYGVVSNVKGCDDTMKPGVFTKVSNYVNWIHKSLN